MSRRIECNPFGNWDGYEDGKLVKKFVGSPINQKIKAEKWLAEAKKPKPATNDQPTSQAKQP